VSALLVQAAVARDKALASVQDDVVDLALAVARKVIGREVETSRTAVAEMCALALANVRRARSVSVRVHPADIGRVEESRPMLANVLGRDAGLVLEPDESVGRGGCVIVSDVGRVDARLEVQLAAIERALRNHE
jgi:flagellar biosynthesis/type III secretory pathway protein FliH